MENESLGPGVERLEPDGSAEPVPAVPAKIQSMSAPRGVLL